MQFSTSCCQQLLAGAELSSPHAMKAAGLLPAASQVQAYIVPTSPICSCREMQLWAVVDVFSTVSAPSVCSTHI